MINSVSKASFGNQATVMEKVPQEQLSAPGLYTMDNVMAPPPPDAYYPSNYTYEKRDSGFLGFLGKVLLTAAVVAGGAVGVRKTLMNDYKVVEKLADTATKGEKFKNNFAKYTDKLIEKSVKIYDSTLAKVREYLAKSDKNKPGESSKAPEAPKAEDKKS